ncbi:MAG: DUF5663 domain-containing protein [bacterium]
MVEEKQQLNFLESYILEVLKQNGFDDLTPENQEEFLPQFVIEAQRRIGATLMPLLEEEKAESMMSMVDNPDTTDEQWWNFWNQAVPNFKETVSKILENYTNDLKKVLSGL